MHDEADDGGDDDGISDSSRLTFDCFLHLLGQMRRKAQGLFPSRLVQSDRRAIAHDHEPQLLLNDRHKATATSKKGVRIPRKATRRNVTSARPKTENPTILCCRDTAPNLLLIMPLHF